MTEYILTEIQKGKLMMSAKSAKNLSDAFLDPNTQTLSQILNVIDAEVKGACKSGSYTTCIHVPAILYVSDLDKHIGWGVHVTNAVFRCAKNSQFTYLESYSNELEAILSDLGYQVDIEVPELSDDLISCYNKGTTALIRLAW